MQTRKNDWMDAKTLKLFFGFDIKWNGRWLHAVADGKPCLFTTPEERDAEQARVRKMSHEPKP